MIQESNESLEWYALPNIMQNTFHVNIYGFVNHDDPQMCVALRRALASSVKKWVNREHDGFVLQDGTVIEFTAPNPPIYAVSGLGPLILSLNI